MTDDYQVCLEASDQDEFVQRILDEVQRFNRSKAGPLNASRLLLSARDAKGEIVGGLAGISFWNGLFIDLLWVAEQQRNRGIGRALMHLAKTEGRNRRCQVVFLSTFSFQAPGFYERLGYRPFGVLQDMPLGASRTWYSKWLS